MTRLQTGALLLLIVLCDASVVWRHSFEFCAMAAGALSGQCLWRVFGRRGRRWLLLAVGLPLALLLAGLDRLADTLCFPPSLLPGHPLAHAPFSGPLWLLSNIFAGWLTNPNPGAAGEPEVPRDAP